MHTPLFISRRSFLASSLALGVGASVQALIPARAWAAPSPAKLLVVNLNGGMDGLAALQPSTGVVYDTLRSLRPTLAKDPVTLLPAGNSFGLHPNLGTLKALFDEGSAAAILNVGCKNMSRSHLEAEIALTRAVPDFRSASSAGLINRIGSEYGWTSLRAMGVTGDDPIFAGGDYRAVQARSLDDLYFRAFDGNYHAVDQLVGTMYDFAAGTELDATKSSQKEYVTNLSTVINNTDAVQAGVKSTTFALPYSQNQFAKAFRSAEIAFRAPQIGSQVVYMRPGGFDTHSTQAARIDDLFSQFNAALGVFVSNMKGASLWGDMIILVISEFGRTSAENGSAGTDHGGANVVFTLGGRVNGGVIVGDLTSTQLTSTGWLQPLYNYAEVYRQVLAPLGIDPNKIVPVTDGPSLGGLFKG